MRHEERRLEYELSFARHLHMGPRDVDQLTFAEFQRFCIYLDEIQRRGAI